MKQQKKHSGLRIGLYGFLLLLLLFLSGAALYCFFTEPDRLILVRETVRIPGLPEAFDGFRIAVMSDFHLTTKADDLSLFRRAVALANAQSPDAVFLLGDFVEGNIPGYGGEIQLTDGLETLCHQERMVAVDFEGRRYDTGNLCGFLEATLEIALDHPETGDWLRRYMKEQALQF